MLDFKVKMHQIRFRLGLRPRPRWRSLQRFPRPPSWIWGPTSKEREGKGRGWGQGVGMRKGGREGIEEGPPGTCLHPPYEILNKTLQVAHFRYRKRKRISVGFYFDGLTWVTMTPQILRQIYATAHYHHV